METAINRAGYLRESYHYFHLKDTAGQELDFHFHEFDKLIILISVKVDYRVESSSYELRPWDVLLVAAALDAIIHLAGDKDDELIELMEMEVELLSGSVPEMEIMIALAQISGSVYSSFHSTHL